ncbi:MAG: 50S ribosomal protein L11 [Candidatus Aenigmatarchaeota archaeon]
MGKQSIKVMVEGGKAVPGPPLGPALATAKVNVGKVVADINEKTKEFKGIKVPVEVVVNTDTKEYEISVGSPPISQMIKKEIKAEKLSSTPWSKPAAKEGEAAPKEFKESITMEALIKIAISKKDSMKTPDLKAAVKEALGSCLSCGVMVEGKNPKEIIKEISEGKWDSKIRA